MPSGQRFEMVPADEMMIVKRLQRPGKAARVKQMVSAWDENKVGCLHGANLTDGKHKKHKHTHVADGGHRWKAGVLAAGGKITEDAELVTASFNVGMPVPKFPVFIRDLTEQGAAALFTALNVDSKTPLAVDQYLVGLVEERPIYLAIKAGLDAVPLEVDTSGRYGNGQIGAISAIKSCERIVENRWRVLGKKDSDWPAASDRLTEVLNITREAYTDVTAHDSDLIQAVALLLAMNEDKFKTKYARDRLVKILPVRTVAQWRHKSAAMRQTFGGSESRGAYLAGLVKVEYNKRIAPDKHITGPIVVDDMEDENE